MKLIIGLGNPGKEYARNRHNVGHMFVDFLKKQEDLPSDWKILTTEKYMNDSGDDVVSQVNFYKVPPNDLAIVHDDLDLVLGTFKIQLGVSPKVHNGVNSVEEKLGSKEFHRVRIGVDNRDSQNRQDGKTYVLENFTVEEQEVLEKLFGEIYERLKVSFS